MSNGMIWPGGARLAVSIVVNVEEGAEMSVADGDKRAEAVDELGMQLKPGMRNYSNESNYQYGIKAGAPRVLDLLAKHRIPATFTAAAQSLERAPALAQRIADEGHETCAHGYRWQVQHNMDEAAERDFIRRAAESIERTTGTRPLGWLSRYLFTANTRRLLIEEGFGYHMDDFSDDKPFWDTTAKPGHPVLIMPYAVDSNDMKMWNAPSYTPRQWLDYANDTFAWLYGEGEAAPRMMSLGVHLRIIGRPGRIGAFDRFLERAKAHDGVWFATRAQIADHWAAEVEPAPVT
jgi:peptidoglycan/xylan/chitin deacetylase (PgdA/CDA1 family)